MIERIKQYFKDLRLRRLLRRDFVVPKSAMEKTRVLFYEALQNQSARTHTHSSYVFWTRYALTSLFALIFIGGGIVTYADRTDVPATHPLYTYKLLAEEARLQSVPLEKKIDLEIEFAERRIRELDALNDEAVSTQETPAMDTFSTSLQAPARKATSSEDNSESKTNKNKRNEKREQLKIQVKENLQKHLKSIEEYEARRVKSKKKD